MRTEPVTVVVSRHVKAGHEAAYEQWIRDVTDEVLKFNGNLGVNVFTPTAPGGPYVIVYKFDSGDHLDTWLSSPVRADYVKRGEALCDDTKAEHVSGLESWFTLPGARAMSPPPKWKMALVTGTTVWAMGLVLGPIVRDPLIALGLPQPLVALCATAVMVSLLTWLVMPQVTKLLRRWLFVTSK